MIFFTEPHICTPIISFVSLNFSVSFIMRAYYDYNKALELQNMGNYNGEEFVSFD